MANTVHIDVVSAEASIFSGEAEFVVAPAGVGEVGIYPNHAPMITTIKPGALRIQLADAAEEVPGSELPLDKVAADELPVDVGDKPSPRFLVDAPAATLPRRRAVKSCS